jgi:hypothetical protein
MAVEHIAFDDTTTHGRQLRSCLQQIEDGFTGLTDLFAVMGLMRDGEKVTSYLVGKFGFPDIATAQAAYDDLANLQQGLTTPEATAFMQHLIQTFRKFG